VILRLARRTAHALGDVQYTEWGERFYTPREGDMVVTSYAGPTVRWQIRNGVPRPLGDGEHPWRRVLNQWEPADRMTDRTFMDDAHRALYAERMRNKAQARTAKRRERQNRAWARARRR
jgi:hypothetical protein